MTKLLGALAALSCCAALAQQPDYSKVEIKTIPLGSHTYMMTGAGGNLGLSVGDDATFLIDDQFAPLTPKIRAAIAALTDKPVKFVLNTHWHFDHTGGNENLGGSGAVIVAHENVRRRMSTEQFIEFMKMQVPASPHAALPVITFAAGLTFHLNGDEMRVMHVPRAHTDGDAIVHFVKSDVIHMGDVFFNGMYPFIDTSSGGSIDGMVAGCDMALAIAADSTKIIPGHGPLGTRADLQAYRDMLATISARVKKLVAEGRKPDEIARAGVSAEFDGKYGKGFVDGPKFAEMVAVNILKR
ncbi:MAG TPA: MBL fold metallo-hydrolase [Usitatibacter sp.]|jgi:glyoxylase-like metal-dependent hydrolase (beta-lactamase superfamily II)|nr:MBL fold metallo-hydrolase [Usitatibacter sp.]